MVDTKKHIIFVVNLWKGVVTEVVSFSICF